jgi:hypothetical protein
MFNEPSSLSASSRASIASIRFSSASVGSVSWNFFSSAFISASSLLASWNLGSFFISVANDRIARSTLFSVSMLSV